MCGFAAIAPRLVFSNEQRQINHELKICVLQDLELYLDLGQEHISFFFFSFMYIIDKSLRR